MVGVFVFGLLNQFGLNVVAIFSFSFGVSISSSLTTCEAAQVMTLVFGFYWNRCCMSKDEVIFECECV